MGSAFARNGQCGICFLGPTDGSVERSTFDGNRVGVVATGTARPSLLGLVIEGGHVGLHVSDAAAPQIDGVAISRTGGAAVVYIGSAGGGFDNVTCRDVPIGIAVGPEVGPRLGETDCEIARAR